MAEGVAGQQPGRDPGLPRCEDMSGGLAEKRALQKERTGYTGKTVLQLVEVGHVGRPGRSIVEVVKERPRPAARRSSPSGRWQASWGRALLRGDVEEGEASWVAFLVPVVDPTGEPGH